MAAHASAAAALLALAALCSAALYYGAAALSGAEVEGPAAIVVDGARASGSAVEVYVRCAGPGPALVDSVCVLKSTGEVVLCKSGLGVRVEPGASAKLSVELPPGLESGRYLVEVSAAGGAKALAKVDLP